MLQSALCVLHQSCGKEPEAAAKSETLLIELEAMMESTWRFDLVMPIWRSLPTSTFQRWFIWWSDFWRDLTPDQIATIREAFMTRQPVPECLWPAGHWLKTELRTCILLETLSRCHAFLKGVK